MGAEAPHRPMTILFTPSLLGDLLCLLLSLREAVALFRTRVQCDYWLSQTNGGGCQVTGNPGEIVWSFEPSSRHARTSSGSQPLTVTFVDHFSILINYCNQVRKVISEKSRAAHQRRTYVIRNADALKALGLPKLRMSKRLRLPAMVEVRCQGPTDEPQTHHLTTRKSSYHLHQNI